MNSKINSVPPAFFALGAAFLFGASIPTAKLLLGGLSPYLIAGLFYLGSGIGLTIYYFLSCYLLSHFKEQIQSLRAADISWLATAIIFGGIAGPLFLMSGLTTTQAAAASLLLNLEGVFTALIAWFVFKEHTDSRIVLGMVVIILGSLLLCWVPGQKILFSPGSLAIIFACFCWALDNNFTRNISHTNPVQIAAVKGIVAGSINCFIAFRLGSALPGFPIAIVAGAVGLLGYGISLVLFIKALHYLGTARTGAYYSTAPFAGAILSIVFLHEPITLNLIIAGILMSIGVFLHLTETHSHEHIHPAQEHEHLHVHDEHHTHEHRPDDPKGEPHSHLHKHLELKHSHPHYPDSEHRHEH